MSIEINKFTKSMTVELCLHWELFKDLLGPAGRYPDRERSSSSIFILPKRLYRVNTGELESSWIEHGHSIVPERVVLSPHVPVINHCLVGRISHVAGVHGTRRYVWNLKISLYILTCI